MKQKAMPPASDRRAYTQAMATLPPDISVTVSSAKLEKVVKPPKRPVMANRLQLRAEPKLSRKPHSTPIRNDPMRFTANVDINLWPPMSHSDTA